MYRAGRFQEPGNPCSDGVAVRLQTTTESASAFCRCGGTEDTFATSRKLGVDGRLGTGDHLAFATREAAGHLDSFSSIPPTGGNSARPQI